MSLYLLLDAIKTEFTDIFNYSVALVLIPELFYFTHHLIPQAYCKEKLVMSSWSSSVQVSLISTTEIVKNESC